MKKSIEIAIFFLFLAFFMSCKTKTALVENVRNSRDSIENIQLRQIISETEKQLNTTKMQLSVNEQKVSALIEKLNITDSEKQQLREGVETFVKEYNDKGILIKETYSKKTSELMKDKSRLEEQNKSLNDNYNSQIKLISDYKSKINLMTDMNTEMNKKVQLLEKQNTDLKLKKETETGFNWYLMAISFAVGMLAAFAIHHYFGSAIGKFIAFIIKLSGNIKL